MKYELNNTEGLWEVTTEGDVESRTTRHLGTHKGKLEDIAFALADKAFYGLRFKPVEPLELTVRKKEVHVSLDIDSGTWNVNSEERADFFNRIIDNRNVTAYKSNYYACVLLRTTKDVNMTPKERALSKLTEEDKKALGL